MEEKEMIEKAQQVFNAQVDAKLNKPEEKPLQPIQQVQNQAVQTVQPVHQEFMGDRFAQSMENVKINVLADASVEDKNFVKDVKDNLKKAAIKHTEIEKDKAAYVEQRVKAESEKLSKDQAKNKHEMAEDRWANKQKKRQYVYDGVKPIMKFVGIDEPMSVLLTILFTVVLIGFFLVAKLLNGTVGILIDTVRNDKSDKAMKVIAWTVLIILMLFALFIAIYLFLKSQGIYMFK